MGDSDVKRTKKRSVVEGQTYIVVTGLNYGPDDKRAEPGDEISDLPVESIEWLLEQGHIKPKEIE